jgi:hypothetical protein
VVDVEVGQVVRMAAAELGVFLEQALLQVEAQFLGLVVVKALPVDLAGRTSGNLFTWPLA